MVSTRLDSDIVATSLRDPDGNPVLFKESLDRLSQDELRRFGLDYYLLNLWSVFRSAWNRRESEIVAERCLRSRLWSGWEYHRYLRTLAHDLLNNDRQLERPPIPCLAGWDVPQIKSLIKEYGGIIISSFHYGPYRYIGTDLALLGFDTFVLADEQGSAQLNGMLAYTKATVPMYSAEAQCSRSACTSNIHRFHPLPVSDSSSSILEIRKALRAGAIVVIYADGNMGRGGAWSSNGRLPVSFLGLPIRPKAGVARFSAMFGCPIVPVIASTSSSGTRQVSVGEPLSPQQGIRDDRKDQQTRVMQSLYDYLAAAIINDPGQWEGACFLHRWRTPSSSRTPATHGSEAGTEGVARLQEHRYLKINEDRIHEIQRDGARIWVDVETLTAYAVPEDLFTALQAVGTYSPRASGKESCTPPTPAMITALAQLISAGLVTNTQASVTA